MSFFGVQLNAQVNRLLYEIRLTLAKNQYMPNIRTIYRSCAKHDPEQSGWLTPAHFEQALNQNGIFFKKFQWQAFQKVFTHQGTIGWLAFIAQLRVPINLPRGQVVDSVWQSLDPNCSGKVHYSVLSDRFDACEFKEFKLGYKNKEVILKQLFGLVDIDADGFISYGEFINFYTQLSVNIPSDQSFCRFLCCQWKHKYEARPVTRVEEVKTSLRTIRFKLLQKANNTHEEFVLRKIFNQFDVNKDGRLNAENLELMLVKLQIPTEKRLLQGIVSKVSRSKEGEFDFQDLAQFVFYDPYHI